MNISRGGAGSGLVGAREIGEVGDLIDGDLTDGDLIDGAGAIGGLGLRDIVGVPAAEDWLSVLVDALGAITGVLLLVRLA